MNDAFALKVNKQVEKLQTHSLSDIEAEVTRKRLEKLIRRTYPKNREITFLYSKTYGF